MVGQGSNQTSCDFWAAIIIKYHITLMMNHHSWSQIIIKYHYRYQNLRIPVPVVCSYYQALSLHCKDDWVMMTPNRKTKNAPRSWWFRNPILVLRAQIYEIPEKSSHPQHETQTSSELVKHFQHAATIMQPRCCKSGAGCPKQPWKHWVAKWNTTAIPIQSMYGIIYTVPISGWFLW